MLQEFTHFRDQLKRVGYIQNVGLALGPAAVWIEVDGAPLSDETPAHHMRLLTVAAGREPLGVPWCRPRLADLVQVAHEGEDVLSLARLVHQRLAAPERGVGFVEKTRDDLRGFLE